MKWIAAAFLPALLAVVSAVYAGPVDINTADAKALDKAMTGVGPKLARAIVDYRTKNGPFKSLDELAKVKGVGKSMIEKNRANLTVAAPTTK